MEPFKFAGVKFTRLGLKDCAINAMESVRNRRKFVVAVPSSRMVSYAMRDKGYWDYVNQADLAIPDSMSYVWASKFTKTPVKERVTGPDFMEEICRLASTNGCKVYFLGANESTLVKLSENLKKKFPSLNICGTQPLPFGELSEMGTNDIIEAINHAKPDVLFVGMSAPKQEFWIQNNMDRVSAYLFAGVGAAFDFMSGVVPRAPEIMRRFGLEWAHRHIADPKRKISNPIRRSPYYFYQLIILILLNHPSLLKLYILLRVLKDDGFFRFLQAVSQKVINYEKRFIWIKKFSQESEPAPLINYKELDEHTLINLQYNRSFGCVEKFWNIAHGAQKCVGFYQGDSLIGFAWVYHSGCPRYDLKEGEAFIGPAVTLKESQRRCTQKYLLICLGNYLQREGFNNVYSTNGIKNYPSTGGLTAADFKISHIQKRLLIFGKTIFSINK